MIYKNPSAYEVSASLANALDNSDIGDESSDGDGEDESPVGSEAT